MNPLPPGLEIGAWAFGSALILGLLVWHYSKSEQINDNTLVDNSDAPDQQLQPDDEWQRLIDRAGAIIQTALAELPDDVRAEAESVPVLFEERAANEKPGRTTLGIYRGFVPDRVSPRKGPIVLYLRSIEDFAGRAPGAFEEQVRRTFLHELGHHLGWGEVDLEARGL